MITLSTRFSSEIRGEITKVLFSKFLFHLTFCLHAPPTYCCNRKYWKAIASLFISKIKKALKRFLSLQSLSYQIADLHQGATSTIPDKIRFNYASSEALGGFVSQSPSSTSKRTVVPSRSIVISLELT
jgi:hypothetical protein